MYIYIRKYAYIYIYIYICACMCVCVCVQPSDLLASFLSGKKLESSFLRE